MQKCKCISAYSLTLIFLQHMLACWIALCPYISCVLSHANEILFHTFTLLYTYIFVNQCLINVKPWAINLFTSYSRAIGLCERCCLDTQVCNTQCSVLCLNAWLGVIYALYMLPALHIYGDMSITADRKRACHPSCPRVCDLPWPLVAQANWGEKNISACVQWQDWRWPGWVQT